ncbi:hypothetical protein C8Q70DRAFT_1075065, partial [Cubamyces menziesii]
TAGASQGGLVHVVFRDSLQRVLNYWLFHNGFSIGIGDIIVDRKTTEYIPEQIAIRKQNVQQVIDDAYHDRLQPAPGMTLRESFEKRVERELNLVRDYSGQYAKKNLKEDNTVRVKQMVIARTEGFIHQHLADVSLCRPSVRRGQAHSFRVPSSRVTSLHEGLLQSRGPWIR